MNNKDVIGRRICEIRKKFNYSQSSIASYLNVDQSLISLIEQGKRSITVDMLNKLTDLFGVPFETFDSDDWDSNKLNIAFRANKLSDDDMHAISDINRIALNCEFMQKIIDRR